MKQVGSRVSVLRKNAKLTQTDLAEAASLSKDFISRLERGITGVSVENLAAIAQKLGVPLKEVFNFDDAQAQFGEIESVTVTVRRPDGTVMETTVNRTGHPKTGA